MTAEARLNKGDIVKNKYTNTRGVVTKTYVKKQCLRLDIAWETGGNSFDVPHMMVEKILSIIPLKAEPDN